MVSVNPKEKLAITVIGILQKTLENTGKVLDKAR
jgi:hypothetical protein